MTRTRWILTIGVVLMAACRSAAENGTLEGQVTVGPLVPVMREGQPTPTPSPAVYAGREVVVYASRGRAADGQDVNAGKEVARARIDAKGYYQVALRPGTYLVDINRAGIDRGIGLPTTVEIAAGQVTRLDIEIDTGIR